MNITFAFDFFFCKGEPRKSKLIQLFRGYVVVTWKEIDLQTCAHWEKKFIGMADAAVGGGKR